MPGLELLRFVAAFAVLIWHYQHFFYVTGRRPVGFDRGVQPLYQPLQLFYDYGALGVHVFWGISGFIFFWQYGDLIAQRAVGPRQFFVLRFSRLYPLHLATLLLVAVAQLLYQAERGRSFVYQANDLTHFGLHLLMANGWGAPRVYSFNGPTWSVSLEVFVYVAFFLLARHVSSSPVINIVIVALWPIIWHLGLRSLAFDALALFYAGGLAALLMRRLDGTRVERPASYLAWVGAVMGLVALRDVQIHTPEALPYALMAWVPVLVYAAASDWLPRSWERLADLLGSLTYASYLLHFPVQVLVMYVASLAGTAVPAGHVCFLVLYLVMILTTSYVVYQRFEKPAQAMLRRRLRARSPAQL